MSYFPYTSTRLWGLIDWFNHQTRRLRIRQERRQARDRELAAAQERIRRDQSAAAFDRKIALHRKKGP